MASNFYYIYALKDTRTSPARPFYIGKGTGSRAYDHLVKPDSTRKYGRIQKIVEAGRKPLVAILADDLTESQALKLEAELIAAFGTEATGGPLTNSVVPVGLGGKKRERELSCASRRCRKSSEWFGVSKDGDPGVCSCKFYRHY